MEDQVRRTGTVVYAVMAENRNFGLLANRRLRKLGRKRLAILDIALRERKAVIARDQKGGVIAAFPNIAEALPCAADFQRRMLAENKVGAEQGHIWFHVGIAMGEILIGKSDINGGAVEDARNIASSSAAGELRVSAEVREANPDTGRYPFEESPTKAAASDGGFPPSYRFMMEAPSAATFDNYDAPVPPKWGWEVVVPMLFTAALIGLFTSYLLDR